MDLYQMVLYVKTVKVLDRNWNITDKRDNNVVCLYFGNNDTLSILKKDQNTIKTEFPGSG